MLTGAWGRGGMSIALTLIPSAPVSRDLLLTIRIGVVIFTVIVQGPSLPRCTDRRSGHRIERKFILPQFACLKP